MPSRNPLDPIPHPPRTPWLGNLLCVCGDASRMAPDVRRGFAAIHAQKTGGGETAAHRWLDELTAENHYLVDVWAVS
jgi:cytochrome P450/NADPH-cytochrome P450 reductase